MSRRHAAWRIALFAMATSCAGSSPPQAKPFTERQPAFPLARVRVHLRSKALPRFERALLSDYPCPPIEKNPDATVDAVPIRSTPPTHDPHFENGGFGQIRACYEEGLRRDPLLEGQVAVEFTVDKTGNARDAHAVCVSLPDPAVVDCVVNAMTRISFPAHDGGPNTVRYPFVLITTD